MNKWKPLSVLLIACLIDAGLLQAQPQPRNLYSHFSRDEIEKALIPVAEWHPFPRTMEEWNEILPDTVRQKLIHEAEKYAPVSFESLPATLMLEYSRMGNRSHYEDVSFGKRERLFALALAEAIEQKGRFTDAIVNGVWSICEESFWGVPAHIPQRTGAGLADVEDPIVDLFAAETGAALSFVDYLVGTQLDKISPLVRRRIYYEVNRRIFSPLEKDAGRYWYFSELANNWNPWITSNWMTCLLLLEKDEKRRADELYHAMTLTDIYLNKLGDDGAVDEGPGYWFDAIGRLFVGLSMIESATAGHINLFKDDFIRRLASYIYKTHIAGDYFISIADAYPVLHPDGLMLYRFGKAVNDTALKNFGAWFFHRDQNISREEFTMADRLWNLSVLKECAGQHASETLLQDIWFKNIQLMASRSVNGLFVASHGGHNAESHNHNDVGDVIVYADGKPVVIDVGSGTYVAKTFSNDRYTLWYNSSAYHNVPLINGMQQHEGRQYEARDVKYTSNPSETRLQMDIAAAYPAEAGVKQWVRTVTIEKKKGRVVIKDNYTSDNPLKELTQTFMTVCSVDLQQPGKIYFDVGGKKVLMEYDPSVWTVTKESPLTHSPDEKQLEENWSHRPVWRLLLTCRKPFSKGKFTYIFKM